MAGRMDGQTMMIDTRSTFVSTASIALCCALARVLSMAAVSHLSTGEFLRRYVSESPLCLSSQRSTALQRQQPTLTCV